MLDFTLLSGLLQDFPCGSQKVRKIELLILPSFRASYRTFPVEVRKSEKLNP